MSDLPHEPAPPDPGEVSDDPLSGETVAGRFRVIRAVAKGGMATVYHAVQMQLGRDVALKVLHPTDGNAGQRKDARRRFLNEAASTAKLSHPNTVVIHDYGELGDEGCYIAMELLDGRTLRQVIREEGPLSPERVIHIGLQMAGSLAEAHDAGLIHRDVKPGNVMLTTRGADPDFVKVLDFGLVKMTREDADVSMSQSGAMVGTPRYMAPEQVFVDEVTPATDVYGLGATLYHALAGRPPFDSDSRFVLMAAHISTEPPTVSETREGDEPVPEALEEAIMRCLRKDPAARFPGMRELAEALEASRGEGQTPKVLRASLPASSAPVSEPSRPALSVPTLIEPANAATDSTLEAPREALAAPPQRSPWPAIVGVGALVAIAIGLLAVFRSPTPEPPPAADATATRTEAARPDTPLVHVRTDPPGAQVSRDGEDLGDAPLTLRVPDGERWRLTVQADGFAPRTVSVASTQEDVHVRLVPASPVAEPARPARRRRPRASPEPPAAEPPSAPPATPALPSERPTTDNRDPWAD